MTGRAAGRAAGRGRRALQEGAERAVGPGPRGAEADGEMQRRPTGRISPVPVHLRNHGPYTIRPPISSHVYDRRSRPLSAITLRVVSGHMRRYPQLTGEEGECVCARVREVRVPLSLLSSIIPEQIL